jgi:hypothetical protein
LDDDGVVERFRFFDGYVSIRSHDIAEVLDITNVGFESKALQAMRQGPPVTQVKACRSDSGLVKQILSESRLLTVHYEYEDPVACLIGLPRPLPRGLSLTCLDEEARLDSEPTLLEWSEVSRLDWNGRYELALSSAWGASA